MPSVFHLTSDLEMRRLDTGVSLGGNLRVAVVAGVVDLNHPRFGHQPLQQETLHLVLFDAVCQVHNVMNSDLGGVRCVEDCTHSRCVVLGERRDVISSCCANDAADYGRFLDPKSFVLCRQHAWSIFPAASNARSEGCPLPETMAPDGLSVDLRICFQILAAEESETREGLKECLQGVPEEGYVTVTWPVQEIKKEQCGGYVPSLAVERINGSVHLAIILDSLVGCRVLVDLIGDQKRCNQVLNRLSTSVETSTTLLLLWLCHETEDCEPESARINWNLT